MTSSPAISIVLPTYNGSTYIRKSIESCLQQTFTNFELIIVNDCSTDDTLKIIQEYAAKDHRIRIINNEFNKKLPLSLNTGFEKAQGIYFTWTSDDNFYAPGALQVMYETLQQDPAIDLVYTDYYLIDEMDKVFGTRQFGDVNQSFNKWLGAGACFLYKKEVHVQNNGYNPAAFLIEDYDFFCRAFVKFSFKYIPTPEYYYYREHSASLTAAHKITVNDISKIFLERNLPGLEKKLSHFELGLVYRKLAVYYAVTKNHSGKYFHFLAKLRKISLKQVFITVFYVFFKKIIHTIAIGFSGIFYFLKLLFKK
jgi:glycosyltransferase involved in cell wall biosynthesis